MDIHVHTDLMRTVRSGYYVLRVHCIVHAPSKKGLELSQSAFPLKAQLSEGKLIENNNNTQLSKLRFVVVFLVVVALGRRGGGWTTDLPFCGLAQRNAGAMMELCVTRGERAALAQHSGQREYSVHK